MREFITEDGGHYNSFLECISKSNFTIKDLDRNLVLEFLIYGELYFSKTFIKGVRKEFTHQPYLLHTENGFIKNKASTHHPLKDEIIEDPIDRFIRFFENRKEYLKRRRKVSVDLTGGIDSRLIATIFRYLDIPFEATFSLDSGTENEMKIVERVADELEVKLHILKSDEVSSKTELAELFRLGDGCWDLLGLKSLRNTQNWRKENGFDLVITGVGGELYKDFFWQQDFPYYRKSTSSIRKLVNLRMYPLTINPDWLSQSLSPILSDVKEGFIERLNRFKSSINTKTYDQIYYNVRVKEHISLVSKATLNYLDTYSPLLEPELLEIGYNLPRRKRFMNRFHRDVISRVNPNVSKIPTTEGGMSVSNSEAYIIKDLFKYGVDKSKKIMSKFVLQPKNVNNSSVVKENDMLQNELSASELPEELHGRIITIGYVIAELAK